ncbi:uncharacterized protein UHOD_11860 [Ustilago sp. UG-2017b]|nr:uncharacterized protein UHOD_11860 [Ustilago sp. UG-2017b]
MTAGPFQHVGTGQFNSPTPDAMSEQKRFLGSKANRDCSALLDPYCPFCDVRRNNVSEASWPVRPGHARVTVMALLWYHLNSWPFGHNARLSSARALAVFFDAAAK